LRKLAPKITECLPQITPRSSLIRRTCNADTGSRGASSTKRTIRSYFKGQGESNSSSTSLFHAAAAPSSSSASNNTSSHSDPINLIDSIGSETVGSGSSGTGTGISPLGPHKKEQPKSNFSTSQKSSSSFPIPVVVSPEIKKQLELLKIAKEQAESKVSLIRILDAGSWIYQRRHRHRQRSNTHCEPFKFIIHNANIHQQCFSNRF
jgi:hypothetical protein